MSSRSSKVHVTDTGDSQTIVWASPKQQEAFSYGPVGGGEGIGGPLLVAGGFGSAKTYALCLKIMWLLSTFPKNRAMICRRVWAELERTTMSTFFKICPPEAYRHGSRSDSKKYLRLNNGSELLWMHMDDPEVEGVIRGIEINAVFIDQAEEISEEIFDLLMGRLGRWDQAEVPQHVLDATPEWSSYDTQGRPTPPNFMLMACNPDTELHWLYRRFHPESPDYTAQRPMARYNTLKGRIETYQSSYREQGYRMITMASYENQFLPAVNLNELLKKDEMFRRRYVEGEWGIPEGQIHYVDEASLIDWTPETIDWIRDKCYLYRGMDHGDAAPTCCLWMAVTEEGDLIFYREYYKPNALISHHRMRIAELSQYEDYRGNYADPSIFHKTMQKYGGRWSIADEYLDSRVLSRMDAVCWLPADNNELGTRNRINEFLAIRQEERPHPVTKVMGKWPRCFFVRKSDAYPDGCDYVIRQVRSARREKIGTEDGRPIFCDERDMKVPDHAYDPFRYLVASRPSVPSTKRPEYSENTFRGKRRMMIRMKRRGRMLRRGAA